MNFQEIYEIILESNLINFIIVMATLVYIFKKCNLGSVIDKMADDIKNNVLTSADAVKAALSDYKKIKNNSKNLEDKKQEIIQDANLIVEKLSEKNKEEIQRKSDEIEAQAQKTQEILYGRKVSKTAKQIQQKIFELSRLQIKNMLDDNMQVQLIKNSLEELDKIDMKGVLNG